MRYCTVSKHSRQRRRRTLFDLLRLMAKVEGGEMQTRRRGRLAATTRGAGTTYLVLTATTPR